MTRFATALGFAVVMLLADTAPSEAGTFPVTTTTDDGPGSLRKAISDAAASPGADTITFAIPGAGPHTISPTSGEFEIFDSGLTIDGTTQPGYAGLPLIEIDGTNAAFVSGFLVIGADCEIRGLAINRFARFGIEISDSDRVKIAASHIGTDPSGTIALPNSDGILVLSSRDVVVGGATAGEGNLISGNTFAGVAFRAGSTGATIAGNRIGTTVSGLVALANGQQGIEVTEGSGFMIGGLTAAERNLISGNGNRGIEIREGSADNVIVGNWVGLDASGAASLGNALGISVRGSSSTGIGGVTAAARNVISGNRGTGIEIEDSTGSSISGNFVGTDSSGTTAVRNSHGIVVDSDDNVIGGDQPGAGNVVSGHASGGSGFGIADRGVGNVVAGNFVGTDVSGTLDLGNFFGICLKGSATRVEGNRVAFNDGSGINDNSRGDQGVAIRGNSIESNGGLGIDVLGIDPIGLGFCEESGVDANDDCDSDQGLQNFPSIDSVTAGGAIEGRLNSLASSTYSLEIFSSPSCDPSGNGEGKTLVATGMVTTGADCEGEFSLMPTTPVGTGELLTATAIDGAGNTSEFSPCFATGGSIATPTSTPIGPTPTGTVQPATPTPPAGATATPRPGATPPTATPTPQSTPAPTSPGGNGGGGGGGAGAGALDSSLTVSVTAFAETVARPGERAETGAVELSNGGGSALTIASLTVEVGDPAQFESIDVNCSAGASAAAGSTTPVGPANVIMLVPPLSVPPGSSATCSVSLTVASALAGAAGPTVVLATMGGGSMPLAAALPALFLLGLHRPRPARAGRWLSLLCAVAFMALAAGCGDEDDDAERSSTQRLSAVAASDGARTVTIVGLPVEIGRVEVR